MLTCSPTIRGKSTNEDERHRQLAGRARRSRAGLVDPGQWPDFNRRFTERPVPDGRIAQLLQEARCAHSNATSGPSTHRSRWCKCLPDMSLSLLVAHGMSSRIATRTVVEMTQSDHTLGRLTPRLLEGVEELSSLRRGLIGSFVRRMRSAMWGCVYPSSKYMVGLRWPASHWLADAGIRRRTLFNMIRAT